MHKFKDSTGREWAIELNGWQLKTLKNEIGFDARSPESILKAANDPSLLCDVLYVLCQEQCKAAGVTDRQFGEALAGDAIDAAADAYMQETVDFFPQRQRPALSAMLAKASEAQSRAAKLAEEKVTSPAMDQMIDRAMSEASQTIDAMLAGTSIGNSSGNAPAPPGSTQCPAPFENSSGLTGGMSMRPGSGPRKSGP